MKAIKTPKLWKKLPRHPLSAEYIDLDGEDYDLLCKSLRVLGFLPDRPIVIHLGKILDGWQRFRACVDTGVTPVFMHLPDGIEPAAYVGAVNDARRHETPEQKAARIAARRERVVEMRDDGMSLRDIAEEEGVSKTTVINDLNDSEGGGPSGGQGCPPETSNSKQKTQSRGPKSAKNGPSRVTGKDGKNYPASKRKVCDRCTRNGGVNGCQACKELNAKPTVKAGDEGFGWTGFNSAFGALVRQIDLCAATYGQVGETPQDNGLRNLLKEFMVNFREWAAGLKKSSKAKP